MNENEKRGWCPIRECWVNITAGFCECTRSKQWSVVLGKPECASEPGVVGGVTGILPEQEGKISRPT